MDPVLRLISDADDLISAVPVFVVMRIGARTARAAESKLDSALAQTLSRTRSVIAQRRAARKTN
jgi:hypothetical protein